MDFHELSHVVNASRDVTSKRVVLKIQVLGVVHVADAIGDVASKTSIVDLDILKGNKIANVAREFSVDIVVIQIKSFKEWQASDVVRDSTFETNIAKIKTNDKAAGVTLNTLPVADVFVCSPVSKVDPCVRTSLATDVEQCLFLRCTYLNAREIPEHWV